jgi:glycine cleavage system H protein
MDPKTLLFSPTHEWVHLDGEIATVGVSQFAVEQLTDLTMIELPKIGAKFAAGKSFGEIESVKNVSPIYAPVAGEVVEINQPVTSQFDLLSTDPYGKGWLIKLKVDSPASTDGLLSHDEYQKKVAEEGH